MGNSLCECLSVIFLMKNGYHPISERKDISISLDKLDAKQWRSLRSRNECHSESIIPLDQPLESPNSNLPFLPAQFTKLYSLGDLLGIGTTAKVYRVHRKKKFFSTPNIKNLACKIIDKRKLTYGMSPKDVDPLLNQLRREVEILRRINHPNIVAFYDVIETHQQIFIITEHLSGGELFEYILSEGPLEENFAKQVLFGVFSAIAYLHDRGVIHRDIKAENLIFFQDIYGKANLKLVDFGFSTIVRNELTGSFLGTGGYIAPEIRQSKNYNMSVDNWALGVLLYCALSAKMPFSVSIDALPHSNELCKDSFSLKFPKKHWSNVSNTCKDLISKLLETDPIKRMTSKEALQHSWFRFSPSRNNQSIRFSSSMPNNPHPHSNPGFIMKRIPDFYDDNFQNSELPELQSRLRPNHSTLELETKHFNFFKIPQRQNLSTISNDVTNELRETDQNPQENDILWIEETVIPYSNVPLSQSKSDFEPKSPILVSALPMTWDIDEASNHQIYLAHSLNSSR